MNREPIIGWGALGSEAFRRKTDVFYGDPKRLMEMAKNGGVTVKELQDFLIYIKKPGNTERAIIESMENTELLVVKILEQEAEVIDYDGHCMKNGHHEEKEDIPTKTELLETRCLQLQARKDALFSQDLKEIDPGILERDDVIMVNFLYMVDNQNIPFDMVFFINGRYSSKITGDFYMQSSLENSPTFAEAFSLPMTSMIVQKGRRRIDIFQNSVFSEIPDVFRNGLHEQYITKMQVFSKEPKKPSEASFLKRIFGRK